MAAEHDPADVQVVWAGNNLNATSDDLLALVTVSDSGTGLPVIDLAKANFAVALLPAEPGVGAYL